MNGAIESAGRHAYVGGMRTIATKLALLLALLLMPFGMAAAPASAAAADASHAGAAMNHCPDGQSGKPQPGGLAECTMACAGTLPAIEAANGRPMILLRAAEPQLAVEPLQGLHPETAIPPPKTS